MKIFFAAAFASLLLLGCASSLEGDVYARDDAQKAMNVRWATVESTRAVVIEGSRSAKGELAGAVIGGAAGYGVTDSRAKALTSAVGAVAGAMAGTAAEEKMTRAQGLEITLKFDDGQHIVTVQEVETVNEFIAGDRVKVITGQGKVRVAR
jgi:outer membrane lipoprotein SlyB